MSAVGGPNPEGMTTIEAPAAATALEHLRLVWAVRLRPGSSRVFAALVGGFGALFLAFCFVVDPSLAVLWCVPVVLVAAGSTYLSIAQWREGGGPNRSVSIGPGGMDVVTASTRLAVPAGCINRWSVAGAAFFALVTRPPTVVYVDVRRYGALSESTVASLFAMASYPVAWDAHLIGHWQHTPDGYRRAARAPFRFRPSLRRRRWAAWLAAVTFTAAVVLVALALEATIDHGWAGARAQIQADGLATTGRVLAIAAVLFAVVGWIGLAVGRAQEQAANRQTWLAVDGDGLELAGDDGTRLRIPWISVDRFRVDGDWIELVTTKPWVGVAIPVPALVPGGRKWLEAALSSRGASSLPLPVPSDPSSGDRTMGERS